MTSNSTFSPYESLYARSTSLVLEQFETGALVLLPSDQRVLMLDRNESMILSLADGTRDCRQIATAVASAVQISEPQALSDTVSLLVRLSAQGIVTTVQPNQDRKENQVMDKTGPEGRYTRNPDVVLREEDEEGGLLFNPDTNQVKVVNTTGSFIWKQCAKACTLAELVAAVQSAFEGAPEDIVKQDVTDFVGGMVDSGFMGVVHEANGAGAAVNG